LSRIHCYLPVEIETELRARAKARKLPLSKYIAAILTREVGKDWPDGWSERVYGGWKDPIERAPQGEYEKRRPL